jgi:hypothetical protein
MPPRSRPTVEDRSEERTEHDGARASVDVPDARHDGDTKAAGRASRRAGKASAELRIPLPDVGRRDPGRLLWYGGLGALAAIGVLEWPVAAVVGAATAIATRSRNDQGQPSAEQPRTRAQ